VEDRDALRKLLSESLDEPVAALRADEPPHGHPLGRRARNFAWTVRTRVSDLLHDRRTETAGTEYDPVHVHPERVRYEPSGWGFLARGLAGREVTRDDVFVDIGSGKGRVVCQAAQYPFRRVLGVEVSERLNEIARQNVDRILPRLACKHVELITEDAARFDIPDDVTVVYLYYPFTGETFSSVVDKLIASLDRRPRRLTVIYACPRRGEALVDTGRFELARISRDGRRDPIGRRIAIYESTAG
jgi:Histone methylation protein DOT1